MSSVGDDYATRQLGILGVSDGGGGQGSIIMSVEPPAKRHKTSRSSPSGCASSARCDSKIGVGVVGPLHTEAAAAFGADYAKIMKKTCSFCGKAVSDGDPLNPNRVRSWNKPAHEGRICAYCGAAKWKLYPSRNASEALARITTNMDEKRRLTQFIDTLIEHYKSGAKSMKNFSGPKQTVEKETEFNTQATTRGAMKLLTSYPYGDPRTNKLGHTLTTARWKDGSIREVVLMPTTPDDKMECSWNNIQSHRHRVQLHNGEMAEHGQLQQLFGELRDQEGACQLTGKVMSPAAPATGAAASTVGFLASGAGSASNDEQQHGKSNDDADSGDELDGGDIMDGILGVALLGASPSLAASCSQVGFKPSAKAKGRAKAAAAKDASAPPPLAKASSAVPRTKCDTASTTWPPEKAERDALSQIQKLNMTYTSFLSSQKASILTQDKKHFKMVKGITDSLSGKLRVLKRDTETKAAACIKLTELMLKIVRAYKQWARKGDSEEFLVENQEAMVFAESAPAVDLQYPSCVAQSIAEMRFHSKMMDTVAAGDTEDMHRRFKLICAEACQGLCLTEEVAEWQREIINEALLRLVEDGAGDVSDLATKLRCFLSPIPRDPGSPLGFQLAEDIQGKLRKLNVILSREGYAFGAAQVNNYLVEIGRSTDETFKIFSSTGTGGKLLMYIKASIQEEAKKAAALSRIDELAKRAKPLAKTLVLFDSELAALGPPLTPAQLANFKKVLKAGLASEGHTIVAHVNKVLGGEADAGEFDQYRCTPLQSMKASGVALPPRFAEASWRPDCRKGKRKESKVGIIVHTCVLAHAIQAELGLWVM